MLMYYQNNSIRNPSKIYIFCKILKIVVKKKNKNISHHILKLLNLKFIEMHLDIYRQNYKTDTTVTGLCNSELRKKAQN